MKKVFFRCLKRMYDTPYHNFICYASQQLTTFVNWKQQNTIKLQPGIELENVDVLIKKMDVNSIIMKYENLKKNYTNEHC
jgi:hypothetical protein